MHYHKRITDKQWEDAKKIDLKANLVNRTAEERQNIDTNQDSEYNSYVNFVKSELMNNKAFKDENLGNVLQSGIKIYTNMDKDVQKHYKMMLIMVASTRIKTNKLVQRFLIVKLVV